MFHLVFQSGEKPGWQIIELGFGVNDQQPNPAILTIEINHAYSSTLAHASSRPTNFPAAARTRNDIA